MNSKARALWDSWIGRILLAAVLWTSIGFVFALSTFRRA